MKLLKPLLLLVSALLVFSLTACNAQTSKEVLADAVKKTKDVKNFTADMKADMTITKDGKATALNVNALMHVNSKPIKAHMNMNMVVEGNKMDMETYIEDNTAYMSISTMPQWIKISNAKELNFAESTKTANPYDGLDMLEKYADKVKLTDTDKGYVLEIKATKNNVDEFLKDYIKKMMLAGQSQELKDAMKNMSVKSLEYTVLIDKETNYPKSMKGNMKASFKDTDGSTVEFEENFTSNYSDYNKTKAFEVPSDVKDKAIEVPADQLKGL